MEFVCFVLFFFCYGVKLTIITHLRHRRGDQYSLVRDFSAFLNFPFGRITLDSIDSPNKVTEILPRTVVTYLKETSIHNLANNEVRRRGRVVNFMVSSRCNANLSSLVYNELNVMHAK